MTSIIAQVDGSGTAVSDTPSRQIGCGRPYRRERQHLARRSGGEVEASSDQPEKESGALKPFFIVVAV